MQIQYNAILDCPFSLLDLQICYWCSDPRFDQWCSGTFYNFIVESNNSVAFELTRKGTPPFLAQHLLNVEGGVYLCDVIWYVPGTHKYRTLVPHPVQDFVGGVVVVPAAHHTIVVDVLCCSNAPRPTTISALPSFRFVTCNIWLHAVLAGIVPPPRVDVRHYTNNKHTVITRTGGERLVPNNNSSK